MSFEREMENSLSLQGLLLARRGSICYSPAASPQGWLLPYGQSEATRTDGPLSLLPAPCAGPLFSCLRSLWV